MLFPYTMIAVWASGLLSVASAQTVTDSVNVKKADGSERNVMLNASDATKPREIQIGLPSEDVNVFLPYIRLLYINCNIIGVVMPVQEKLV